MELTAPPVKQSALKLGLPVIQPEKIKKNEEFQAQLTALAARMQSSSSATAASFRPGCSRCRAYGNINVHASLLPKYRGAAPIQWAIANGENVTGVTTMRLNEGLDTGDILLQEEMAIRPEDTSVTLAPRLAAARRRSAGGNPAWLGTKAIIAHSAGPLPGHARADPEERRWAGRFQPHCHGDPQSPARLSALAGSVHASFAARI